MLTKSRVQLEEMRMPLWQPSMHLKLAATPSPQIHFGCCCRCYCLKLYELDELEEQKSVDNLSWQSPLNLAALLPAACFLKRHSLPSKSCPR